MRTVLRDLLEPLFGSLRRALDALPARPAAFVVVCRECTPPDDLAERLGVPLLLSESGHRYAAAPLERVREVSHQIAPRKTDVFAIRLPDDEVWCLVLGPRGVVVVPIGWSMTQDGAA